MSNYLCEYAFNNVSKWEIHINKTNDIVLLFSPKSGVAMSCDQYFDTNVIMMELFGFVKVGLI